MRNLGVIIIQSSIAGCAKQRYNPFVELGQLNILHCRQLSLLQKEVWRLHRSYVMFCLSPYLHLISNCLFIFFTNLSIWRVLCGCVVNDPISDLTYSLWLNMLVKLIPHKEKRINDQLPARQTRSCKQWCTSLIHTYCAMGPADLSAFLFFSLRWRSPWPVVKAHRNSACVIPQGSGCHHGPPF